MAKFKPEAFFVFCENSEIIHMVLTVKFALDQRVSEKNIELLKDAVMQHNKNIEQ